MTQSTRLEGIDLAALVASRVCHDVISPVGAIVNGLEMLDEEKDEAMRTVALDLIRKSARTASARLQFARIAFGAAGSAGSTIDLGDAEQVTRAFMQDGKTSLVWNAQRSYLPKNRVKLLLNLVVIGLTTVPRGGTLTVEVEGEGDAAALRITTEGTGSRVPAGIERLIAGETEDGTVDAHAIQPFFTGLVARTAGMAVTVEAAGERIILAAAPLPAGAAAVL